jgi:hypothetical protein
MADDKALAGGTGLRGLDYIVGQVDGLGIPRLRGGEGTPRSHEATS